MPLNPKYFVLGAALAGCLGGVRSAAQIRRVENFRDNGRNPAWSVDGRVVFERAGQLVLAGAKPAQDRVVAAHASGAEWHPSGRFFAFTRDGRIVFMDPDSGRILDSFPAGDARDLRFSRDGVRLAWMDSDGAWLRTGKVAVGFRLPVGLELRGIDDFSPDGRELVVTAHPKASSDSRQTEIYACTLAAVACRPLTAKAGQRQDFARVSPGGRKILFASSETAWVPDAPIDYEADFWIQGMDGLGKAQRMTWFNEPANPRYIDATARVAAASWSGDGRWVLATVIEGARQDRFRIVKIEFPEAE